MANYINILKDFSFNLLEAFRIVTLREHIRETRTQDSIPHLARKKDNKQPISVPFSYTPYPSDHSCHDSNASITSSAQREKSHK